MENPRPVFTVDAEHCQRAADELFEILRVQQRGFVERWNAARATRVVLAAARWVGLIGSLLGLLLVGALLYFDTRDWATQPSVWYLPVFAAFVLFFYEAEFDFRGDLLVYLRGKDGVWQLAWSRMLRKFAGRGVAIQAEAITVILKRPRSLYPAVLILQRDREWTASILGAAGLPIQRIP